MGSGSFLPKRILVPTDFSSYAHNAFLRALEIASTYHAAVILLHVIDEQVSQCVVDFCLSETVVQQIRKQQAMATADKLQREINSIVDNRRGGIDITSDVRNGITYDEIIKVQQEKEIDLIVMASHGKTGIVKNLIGSVTEKVVRGAKCPVIVIRN
jgi:nucleotide-binding universal stress UspA family protein